MSGDTADDERPVDTDAPGTASAAGDPDLDALRRDLDHIKTAMGIEDRYPGQRRLWAVHGALVGGAAVLTNVIFAFEIPSSLYILIWFGLVALAGLIQWRSAVATDVDDPGPTPSWRVVFGTLVAGWFVLTAIASSIFGDVPGVVRGAYFFSLSVAVLGMGYLLAGTLLSAYSIRARDRYPYYAAGAWMLLFAFFMPYVEFLQYFGYALFGALFFLHGVGTYYLLTYRWD